MTFDRQLVHCSHLIIKSSNKLPVYVIGVFNWLNSKHSLTFHSIKRQRLDDCWEISVSQMTMDIIPSTHILFFLYKYNRYIYILNMSVTSVSYRNTRISKSLTFTRKVRRHKRCNQKPLIGQTTQWPQEKGQTMICKTLHRKLKIEQHETHYKKLQYTFDN